MMGARNYPKEKYKKRIKWRDHTWAILGPLIASKSVRFFDIEGSERLSMEKIIFPIFFFSVFWFFWPNNRFLPKF